MSGFRTFWLARAGELMTVVRAGAGAGAGAVRAWAVLGLALGLAVLAPTALVFGVPQAALAQEAGAQGITSQEALAQVQVLNGLMSLPQTLDIMVEEGLTQGAEMGQGMFGNSEDPAWSQALNRIYDAARMQGLYDAAMAEILTGDPTLVSDVSTFLGSELGARIVSLELEARRTTLDEMAKGAAREVLAEMETADKPRRALIERLVVAADLIEGNVISALNGNVAFMRAMAEAGAPGSVMDDGEILAQVWDQEPEIRADVADFLYPLMALAYAPLTEDELAQYVDFAESDAGRRYNTALLLAFEPVMLDLSRNLGLEAGRLIAGQVL